MSDSALPSITVGDAIRAVAARFDAAALHFGHGTDSAIDEAAMLVFHVAALAHDGDARHYERRLTRAQQARLETLVSLRVEQRIPGAYLINEAWFAGLSFYVDERVLIPRSPMAELIQRRFAPWLAADRPLNILDIGTGSGCIAIALALALPGSFVTGIDNDPAALQVAAINRVRHALTDRLQLVRTDLTAGLAGPFDLIVANPPYVPASEMHTLPAEYGHEPARALESGEDGLDSARRILQDAPRLLSAHGLVALEVGSTWASLERAFPDWPFLWAELESGGEGIALLAASDWPMPSGAPKTDAPS